MRVGGVLLAAGLSRRFGDDSKLLAQIGGRRLVDYAAASLIAAGLSPLVAVVQSEDEAVSIVLETEGFWPVENPRFAEGMGTSVAAAATHLSGGDIDAVVIALGDMPFVRAETYRAMAAAFERSGGEAIVAAREGDRRGSPTLFPAALLPELAALRGDEGGRSVVAAHRELAVEVECAPGELDDVDTPEALEAARRRLTT